MCARTKITQSFRDIRNKFLTQLDFNLPDTISEFYIPGNTIPFVIKGKQVSRVLTASTWGYPLNNQTNNFVYNARIENVKTKSFWQPYQASRILIPVSSFLERDHWFKHEQSELIALGGLFMRDTFYQSVVICTTNSLQPDLMSVHNRMPFVVRQENWSEWLDPTCDISMFRPITQGYIKDQ